MNEKSILAYFPDLASAEQGVRAILQERLAAGRGNVQIDRVARLGTQTDRYFDMPQTVFAYMGPGMMAGENGWSYSVGGSGRISSQTDGFFEDWGGSETGAFLVTVVTASENADRVVETLRLHGGKT